MQFKSGSITRTGGSRTTDQLSIVATGPRTAGINIPKPRYLMTVPSKRSRAPGPRQRRYIDNIIFSLSLPLSLSFLPLQARFGRTFTLDLGVLAVRYHIPNCRTVTEPFAYSKWLLCSSTTHDTIQSNITIQQQMHRTQSITA